MRILRIQITDVPEGYDGQYPWNNGEKVLLLGEIQNMPGHVAVATKDGKVHWGYHPENFRDPTQEEL